MKKVKYHLLNRGWLWVCLLIVIGWSGCRPSPVFDPRAVIPSPLKLQQQDGRFTFDAATVLAVPGEQQMEVARWFAALFQSPGGFQPQVRVASQGDVCLMLNDSLKEEAYQLEITPQGVHIEASTNKGFFYALQTVRMMLPPVVEGEKKAEVQWSVPCVKITDEPRFAYRGFMLDVARFFMPKEDVMRMIDCMAMLKLNKLHLHLTDDNGWRLEIKKYPLLAEVGAWRVERPGVPFPARENPTPEEKATVGGYYTQEDMKEIVRYAAQRQVEVIPEIDIPAHSNAALAAYPQYTCPVVKQYIGVLPGLGGKNAEIIFCAGNDSTFTFLQDVLDEVMEIFPSRYIHLGGDEAAKTYWKQCPLCQQRIRKEHLASEEDLQGYFMERMSNYVRSKGRTVMGWDELTNTQLPKEAIVFGWRGLGKAALKAAEQGHFIVMTPARVTYLIRYQGPQWFEPLTYFGNNLMKGIFDYEPVQKDWKPVYEQLLLGVQASMWTEFCHSSEEVFYMVFPRLAALAQIAWVQKEQRDWQEFLKGLDGFTAHLDEKGIEYARSMYNIQHQVLPDSLGRLTVSMECERPDVEIRYTLNGSEPTASDCLYSQPFTLTEPAVVKAATFKSKKQMGQMLTLPVQWNKATGKTLLDARSGLPLTKGNAGVMVNGVRGSERQSDFEWYMGKTSQPLDFVVDLGQVETLHRFSMGSISFYGMGVHKPRSWQVEVSADNQHFQQVGALSFTDEAVFRKGRSVEELVIEPDSAVQARYVRYSLQPAGLCPEHHIRSGQKARFYIDEVVIE